MAVNYNTEFKHLAGLERLRHLRENRDERFGMARFLDYSITAIESGSVVLTYEPRAEHVNLIGSVHGGVLSALLDTAMGCALMSVLEAGERHTIIDLHTKFLRPVMTDAEPLSVIGKLEHRGRRQCTMSGRIAAPGDKLCATGTATAVILQE